MPRRTLREARQLLDDAAPGINPEMWKRFNAELTDATNKAVVMANRYMDQRVSQTAEQGPELLTELCAVRDGYAELIAQGASGRISAADYTKQLHALQRRQRNAERHGQQITQAAELVEHIEHDPEAWADETFHAKYEHMKPEFSF